MKYQGHWFWNIEEDDFQIGKSFWNILRSFYTEQFSSAEALETFFIQSEIDDIKESVDRALIRSDDTKFGFETNHIFQRPTASITLKWTGEIVKTDTKNAVIIVAGQVCSAKVFRNQDLQLPNNPEFYQQMMDNLPDSVFFKDLESRFIAINKACANKFGIQNPDAAVGKTDFDFFNVAHAQQAFEDEQKIIETGKPIIHKAEKETYQNEDKSPTWTSTSKLPLYDASGTIIGTFGISTDITDLKRVNRQNKRLRSQLQSIFDSDPNMIFVKDKEGKYVLVNQSKAAFHGLEKTDIIGKTDLGIGIEPEKAKRFRKNDLAVIETNKPVHIPEDETTDQQGNQLWHHTIKVPFQLVESEDSAVLTIVTDITELKERELQLNETLDIISQQNKSLLNFAHIVSHNLRNHAGGISTLLELLNMEDSREERDELLTQLDIASKRLTATITDLNEIIDEQYKTGKVEKEVNLADYFNKTRDILTTDIRKHDVEFEIDIPKELTFKYVPAYLESILLNLTTNAIKYRHPDRKPVIKVKAFEEEGKVYIHFSDNGLGMELDKYGTQLFGMYKTFHGNENSKGIGLFITKNQIENMGGSIDVESKPDEGTTFKIRLN